MASSTHPNRTLHALHAAQMALATVLVLLSGIFVHYAKAVHDTPFHNHYVAGLLVLSMSCCSIICMATLVLGQLIGILVNGLVWILLNAFLLVMWIAVLVAISVISSPIYSYPDNHTKMFARLRAFMFVKIIFFLLVTTAALSRDYSFFLNRRSRFVADETEEAKNTSHGMERADTVDGAHDGVQDLGFQMAVLNAGLH